MLGDYFVHKRLLNQL